MKQYPVDKLRNVVLLGQGRSGKTSFAEAALFLTKGTDRLGKTADGNTVCDFDPEEIKRQISISTAVAPVEYKGHKINFLDTPGYLDFVGEVMQGVRVAETALLVVSGKGGPGVGTEKGFEYASKAGLSKMFFVGSMDVENADFFKTVEQLREVFGISVCPTCCPVMEGEKMVALIDFVERNMKVYKNGVPEIKPLPEDLGDEANALWDMMSESVAETSEELMEKFFNGEYFSREETINGLRAGIADGSIAPVLCGSAVTLEGIDNVLETIVSATPSPADKGDIKAEIDGREGALRPDPDGDLAAIGLAETMSAANRGENFTVIFVNNGIYGMTGGQMAPTTMLGVKTTTTPYGRDIHEHGAPLHMCEILSQLEAPAYIARVTAADVPNAKKAKAAVKKAFQYQLEGKGFSFVEFVSNCPTNWGMSPVESLDHVHNVIMKEFPLGEFRAK